jgi:glycerol kinase
MYLTIDQGTSSTRAILFTDTFQPIAKAQQEFTQWYPQTGWVEHDAEEIFQSVVSVVRSCVQEAGVNPESIVSLGISNQRETVVVWDRKTGAPIHRAIVWQDRRTANHCLSLQDHGADITSRTGLCLDPYFSATKLQWILDSVPDARHRAAAGELAAGTIDSYLLWRLTEGATHATDVTNASRTLLYNIHQHMWDSSLCELFCIPESILPSVRNSADDFGRTHPNTIGFSVPIHGVAGDQQAALIGQGCFLPGSVKCTFGTGLFLVANTGHVPLASGHRLLTTAAYAIDNVTTYALEGSCFVAGAALQWLRDGIQILPHVPDAEIAARVTGYETSVTMVPAFCGLGAPYWEPHAQGALFGLTRDTSRNDIITAALMSCVYQAKDLVETLRKDGLRSITQLQVDGGMVQNTWFCQALADLLDLTVVRNPDTEATARGAAYLAAVGVGTLAWGTPPVGDANVHQTFTPSIPEDLRTRLYERWLQAIDRIRG